VNGSVQPNCADVPLRIHSVTTYSLLLHVTMTHSPVMTAAVSSN